MKATEKARRRRAKRMSATQDALVDSLAKLDWWERLDVLYTLFDRLDEDLVVASGTHPRVVAIPNRETYREDDLRELGPNVCQAGACAHCRIELVSSAKRVSCPLCGEAARLT